ncbi:maleylpyruvate isomerase N-terminal domain-containing protein [Aquihabitans sp. McL0605]|uniref:maleylpyruvate isomerase N-terminal domain-containing protein n=1 Tax=Aquihabitans sp. McL0605 TaxID=3415671 RepID=UPI003CF0D6BD
MEPARHLEILRAETSLLAAVPADVLGAVVPSMDDWTVERIVRHVGKVHQWCNGAIQLRPDQSMEDIAPTPGLPKGPDCLPAYAETVAELLATFESLDPTAARPTFLGPGSVGWWLRRQAQEVSIHRTDAHDAIHAIGGPAPTPIAADGAADGIDEWARFFLAVRWAQRIGTLPPQLAGRTLHIHGTDDPAPADGAEWLLTFTGDGIEVEATHAKGDAALRGPAADLLLALWRRRPLSSLDVVGDAAFAAELLDLARF